MIRARLRVLLDRVLEPFGYRRVYQCPECGGWYPAEGDGNWFQHVLGADIVSLLDGGR